MKYSYHIFSPYRVCPLGAHVDHQHGLVTGFAINKGVDLWFNVREDSLVKLTSLSFEGEVEFEINKPSQVKEKHWGDYARGAKYALRKRFELTHGIDGVLQGSLPVGGLSSSAAVLIAYVMAFAKANGIKLQPFEIVQIASEAEREYIGLNNGLLDQACIALGKKDQLLFLDCDTNEYRHIKFGAAGGSLPKQGGLEGLFEIGIFFSGLTRSLVNSDYNLRVFECKTAAWNMLAYHNAPLKTFDKTFLRDIPKESFDSTRDMMPLRFAKRAEHFYSEYRRVRQGVTAWESGNLQLFGKLSFDSCESSIHNYECGSPELIAIYNILHYGCVNPDQSFLSRDNKSLPKQGDLEGLGSLPGVYGGRFSGAGFKGAVIALVDPAYKESIEKELTEKYLAEYPEYEQTFKVFWVKPDDGARFVED